MAGAYQTGVLGVRSLVRRGVHAVCFDCNPSLPGFRSAYGAARLCPDPDADSDGWLRFMLELARSLPQKAVLIPSSDKFVSAIARHATALAGHYVLSPGAATQGLLADKQIAVRPRSASTACPCRGPAAWSPRPRCWPLPRGVLSLPDQADAFPRMATLSEGHPLLGPRWRSPRTPTLWSRVPTGRPGQRQRHSSGNHPGAGHRQASLPGLLRCGRTAHRKCDVSRASLRPGGFRARQHLGTVSDPETDAYATGSCAASATSGSARSR